MPITLKANNLHDLLDSIPLYKALLLTGASLHFKLNQHATGALGDVQCDDCARFLFLYNGVNGKGHHKYRIRPLHPACATGIKIIRHHLQLHFAKTKSIGRHSSNNPNGSNPYPPYPEAA
jgi:hypothetical protein